MPPKASSGETWSRPRRSDAERSRTSAATSVKGSSDPPNLRRDARAPRAKAATLPRSRVSSVTTRSDSPVSTVRSTIPVSFARPRTAHQRARKRTRPRSPPSSATAGAGAWASSRAAAKASAQEARSRSS